MPRRLLNERDGQDEEINVTHDHMKHINFVSKKDGQFTNAQL